VQAATAVNSNLPDFLGMGDKWVGKSAGGNKGNIKVKI
jgi:hypothetical protein